jgi:hypothetical protein
VGVKEGAVRIEVHIEKLVLEGPAPLPSGALGSALQEELGRLLAAEGLPEHWRAGATVGSLTAALPAALPAAAGGRRAPALGRAIGGAAHRALRSAGADRGPRPGKAAGDG